MKQKDRLKKINEKTIDKPYNVLPSKNVFSKQGRAKDISKLIKNEHNMLRANQQDGKLKLVLSSRIKQSGGICKGAREQRLPDWRWCHLPSFPDNG